MIEKSYWRKETGHWLGQLLLLFFLAGLCGCTLTVRLAGDYDEITDAKVTELRSETSTFLSWMATSVGKEEGSYEANRDFYYRMYGEVDALIDRAVAMEEGLKKTPLKKNFMALKEQYQDLELLHKTGLNDQVIKSVQAAFDQSFRAIVKHLLFLKWNKDEPVK